MAKTNRTQTHAFVLRIWLEGEQEGEYAWRGTILRPHQGTENHFKGPDELITYLNLAMLDESNTFANAWFE